MTTFMVAKNNATGKLLANIDNVQTSFFLQAGDGANFPSTVPFPITIGPAGLSGEIALVNTISGDELTSVSRGQEGTVAVPASAAVAVELRVTARYITNLNTAVNTLEVDTHPKVHVLNDAAIHTGAISDAQHPVVAFGDKHPEYQTPAEHTLVGDAAPHHPTLTLGDTKHSLVAQVLSGVAAALTQQGHITLAKHLGGIADLPEVIDHNVIVTGDLHPEYATLAEAAVDLAVAIANHTAIIGAHHAQLLEGTGINIVSNSINHFQDVNPGLDLHPGYQLRSEANPAGAYGNEMRREWIVLSMHPEGFQASET